MAKNVLGPRRSRLSHLSYAQQLKCAAEAAITWTGEFPEGYMHSYQIERAIQKNAAMVFSITEEYGFTLLPASGKGADINGHFTAWVIHPQGRSSFTLPREEVAVVVDNTVSGAPVSLLVEEYAAKLVEIGETESLNIWQLGKPYIFFADKSLRPSIEAMWSNVNSQSPYLVVADPLLATSIEGGIKLNSTNVQYLGDKLVDLRQNTINDFLIRRGISAVPVQKRERLINAEATQYEEATIVNRNAIMASRLDACKKLKDWGVNLDVAFAG